MTKPYLVRLAKPSVSHLELVPLDYDTKLQVSIVKNDPAARPAVLRDDIPALGTKKADVEKGEDQKDRWLPGHRSS